ncbi:alpha/beta hydrolase [bacterium]|nr:alpha/beta hydrolase [bacterium]
MVKLEFPNYFKVNDSVKIFYSTNFALDAYEPKKPLIVFNYGLACNINHWKFQIAYFHKKGYQLLCHDYRGHYNSSNNIQACDVTFNNIVGDIHALLNSIEAKNVFMLGHSMGVNVTLEYAKNHPHQMLGMGLISGTVLPPQDVMFNSKIMNIINPLQKELMARFPKLYESIWKSAFLNPLTRKLIHLGGFNADTVPDSFIQTYLKKASELSPQMFTQLLDQMQDHDVLAYLDKIQTKTLVIAGDEDKVIPLDVQKIVHANLPSSSLYIVKKGSHVPQVDFPDRINKKVYDFLKSLL